MDNRRSKKNTSMKIKVFGLLQNPWYITMMKRDTFGIMTYGQCDQQMDFACMYITYRQSFRKYKKDSMNFNESIINSLHFIPNYFHHIPLIISINSRHTRFSL
jgi:hypothetical protein